MTSEPSPGNRILVIDDEPSLREACRRALERFGYQVEVAASGREGLSKLGQGCFALVFLDVMMPDINGIELLQHIRNLDREIVCIVITGYATVELAVEAMKLGAYDFIAKPFSDDSLLLAVDKGLERRRRRQEARRLQRVEEEARQLSQEKARLVELDRVKSAFMRQVAHELRAPLAAIRSFLSLILEGYATPEQQRQMEERAAQRTDELLDLINDLLHLARLKDAQHAARRQSVSLEAVLRDVVDLHNPEAEQKGLRLCVEIQPCPSLVADPGHMRELWTNLVSNGIKYTPRGGTVTVRLSAHDGESIIGQVEDTGIGIAEKDMSRLFEEFFRTEQAKCVTEHGTGLGLSIVKQIVEQYGGSIRAESQLGKGTQFTFQLPLIDRPSLE